MSLLKTPTMSESKISAQRTNARRSTGPRSEAGKARSRWVENKRKDSAVRIQGTRSGRGLLEDDDMLAAADDSNDLKAVGGGLGHLLLHRSS